MKRIERAEGTAFTRRKIVENVSEGTEEFRTALKALAARLEDPWEQQRPLINWIKTALQEEADANGPWDKWKPHEDAGWYLREMDIHAQIIDRHIKLGNASWAAHHGALFGELWSELQLKLAREELYLLGKKIVDGAGASRRNSQEARVKAVDDLCASGWPKTAAFAKVAEGEGVTAKAIETDYYKAKRKRS